MLMKRSVHLRNTLVRHLYAAYKNKKGVSEKMMSVILVVVVALFVLSLALSFFSHGRALRRDANKNTQKLLGSDIANIHSTCSAWKYPGLYLDVSIPKDLPTYFDSAGLNDVIPCQKERDKIENCVLKCEALTVLTEYCNVYESEKNLKMCQTSNVRSLLVK